MKVAINNCYGGFSLSPEATVEVWKRGGQVEATPVAEYYKGSERSVTISPRFGLDGALKEWRDYLSRSRAARERSVFLTVFSPDETLVLSVRPENRSDPILVAVIEEMGEAANGACASLKIVEVPDGVDFEISEYDGNEHVAEKHRTWG